MQRALVAAPTRLDLQAQAEAASLSLRAAADLADSRAAGADLRVQLRESEDSAQALQQQLQVSLPSGL